MTNKLNELEKLIQDPHSVVSFHMNDTGDGQYILNADAIIRPSSMYRNVFINPHRTFSNLPHSMVKTCPSCQTEWGTFVNQGVFDTWHCCGISICENTYAQVKNRNLYGESSVAKDMARNTESQMMFNLNIGKDNKDDDVEDVSEMTFDIGGFL
tara:strand:- start:80 stop:541 length:462 start_codon:yes stop_codon:yes gene_type:complete